MVKHCVLTVQFEYLYYCNIVEIHCMHYCLKMWTVVHERSYWIKYIFIYIQKYKYIDICVSFRFCYFSSKMIKSYFYFILKAFFVMKKFKFLSWLFWLCSIVGRGVLILHILWRPPLYFLPPFFKFCPKFSNLIFTTFFLFKNYSLEKVIYLLIRCYKTSFFVLLNNWSHHIWCAILYIDIMDLYMSSLGTLVTEGPCCVFYATRHQVSWGLTHNVVFC